MPRPWVCNRSQRLRRLREWAKRTLPDSPMKNPTLDLCDKRTQFSRSYNHHRAHRTSNRVDRLVKFLDRACFNGQYFHGTLMSAELRVRALALLWNFCPSSPCTVRKHLGELACLSLDERLETLSTESVIKEGCS
jgi:hypothetical protein